MLPAATPQCLNNIEASRMANELFIVMQNDFFKGECIELSIGGSNVNPRMQDGSGSEAFEELLQEPPFSSTRLPSRRGSGLGGSYAGPERLEKLARRLRWLGDLG